MDFVHSVVNASRQRPIQARLENSARVLVMDGPNFAAYRARRRFRALGGWAQQSPFNVVPPYAGQWHVVIDLEGNRGNVKAAVSVLSA